MGLGSGWRRPPDDLRAYGAFLSSCGTKPIGRCGGSDEVVSSRSASNTCLAALLEMVLSTIRAMTAAAFAAITAFEVVFFSEAFVAFGRVVEIFALDGFIFVILCLHAANLRI